MLVAKDFRERARVYLSGNWAVAVGTGFVASLLGAHTGVSVYENFALNNENIQKTMEYLPWNLRYLYVVLLQYIVVIVLGYAIVHLILTGPITLGYIKFHEKLMSGQKPELADLFSQFGRWKEAFVMQFMRLLFLILWLCLFIIPGFVAAYSYFAAPYILYENPGMSGLEAIKASKELMKGNKWRAFCLGFSFLPWSILSALTLGIGYLWMNPYAEAAFYAFYQEIKREKYGKTDIYGF